MASYPISLPLLDFPTIPTKLRPHVTRVILIVAAFIVAFACTLSIDTPTTIWVRDSGLAAAMEGRFHWLSFLARRPGDFRTFTLPAAIVLLVCGRMRKRTSPHWWKPALFVFLSGTLTAANTLVKWIVGRARPFQGEVFQPHPFTHGLAGLGGANQSFPSGDVCLAAATAISLCIVVPRWRPIWLLLVLMVALQRIAVLAHYPSDTVGAVALGWLLALAAKRIVDLVSGDRIWE